MSDRYEIFKHVEEESWVSGSPLLMKAYAFVKDNVTGMVYALCKFENISDDVIDAAYIGITCNGADGEPVQGVEEHVYLDLSTDTGSTFGGDAPILLPDKTTRKYTVTVKKVVFANGETWINQEENVFLPLAKPKPLSTLGHLEEQYRRTTPDHLHANLPEKQAAYWRCGCGQINTSDREDCIRCGHNLEQQLAASDIANLEKQLAEQIEHEKAQERKRILHREEQERKRKARREAAVLMGKKILKVLLPLVALIIIIVVTHTAWKNSNLGKYKAGLSQLESGSYGEAVETFRGLGSYKDSASKAKEAEKALDTMLSRQSIDGSHCTIGLKSDGSVVAVGSNGYGQCKVSGWSNIVAVAGGITHTIGLKSDGSVVAVGSNGYGQCDVSNWLSIVAAAGGFSHTVGLKSDGSVVAVGNNEEGQCDVSRWSDIVAVAGGFYHTVGLKSDGSVVAVGNNEYGQCDVSDWLDIVAVVGGYSHTVGLKSDGSVVAVGNNEEGQCDVSRCLDIVAVAGGYSHTIGLKSDGSVLAVGDNRYGQCDVSDWSDIVAVAGGSYHTVGLKSDGSVVAVGYNKYGQCDVSNWSSIKTK